MMTLLSALCLTLAPAAPQAPAPVSREGDAYLLRVSEDRRDPFDLFELVTLCQEATGVDFACDAGTARELRATPVVLLGPKRVPRNQLIDFLELQLFLSDFTCTEMGPAPIAVVRIQSLVPRSGRPIARDTTRVTPQERLARVHSLRDRSPLSRPRSGAPVRPALEPPVHAPR